ncbi:MAG: hypothetical protein Q8P44_07755, partial [Dehalococcoidia bacterium]|nr:hypothetical protein [Dehalococcoidia bacterium]
KIILLFFLCQSYAVFSTYWDIRGSEFNKIEQSVTAQLKLDENIRAAGQIEFSNKKELLEQHLASLDQDSKQQTEILQQQGTRLEKQIAQLQEQRNSYQSSIDGSQNDLQGILTKEGRTLENYEWLDDVEKQLSADRRAQEGVESQIWQLQQEIAKLAYPTNMQSERNVLLTQIGQLQIRQPSDIPKPDTQSDVDQIDTRIDFIVKNRRTWNSAFAGFIAFLFPITVLAVGFYLAKNKEQVGEHAYLGMEQMLDEGSVLPDDQQIGYAKSLEPVIHAHLAGLRASRSQALATSTLYLELEGTIQTAEECSSLKEQVENSKLASSAKESLIEYIDNLVKDEMFDHKKIY